MYSLEIGLHRPFRRGLALQIGGFFAHRLEPGKYTNPLNSSEVRILSHIFAFGPQLRFGAGNERVFAYALTRLGLGFTVTQFRRPHWVPDEEVDGPQPYFYGSVGAGFLTLVSRRVMLGGELGIDFGGQRRFARGSVIMGVTF